MNLFILNKRIDNLRRHEKWKEGYIKIFEIVYHSTKYTTQKDCILVLLASIPDIQLEEISNVLREYNI